MTHHHLSTITLFVMISTNCLADPIFVMKGSDTIGEFLAPPLAKGFLVAKYNYRQDECVLKTSHTRSRDHLTIDVVCESNSQSHTIRIELGGSITAIDCISEPQCDIAMSSATIEDLIEKSEVGDETASRVRAVDQHHIALDGITIIVNRVNNLNDISTKMLQNFFCNNDPADWGRDPPSSDDPRIERIVRNERAGTLRKMEQYLHCRIHFEKAVGGNIDVSAEVSMRPRAIGFVGFPYIGLNKPLSIDNSSPTIENFAASYPLRRELFLFTKRPMNENVRSFLEFIKGDAGQKIVVDSGFAPIPVPPAEPQPSPRIEEVRGYRLVGTLFFDADSAELDRLKKARLASIAQGINNSNALIRILGYADRMGTGDYNKRLSELRASRVESYLKERGVKCAEPCSIGLGNLFAGNAADPLARKVEIWVK